jgi:hypothetical protein
MADRKRCLDHESRPGSQDREIFADRRQNAGVVDCEVQQLLDVIETSTHTGFRDRALLGTSCLHFRPDRRRRESEGRRLLSFRKAVFAPFLKRKAAKRKSFPCTTSWKSS